MPTQAEIDEVLATVVPPANTVDVMAIIVSEPGGTLPNGTPNGLGGRTRYGAAWFDGLKKGEPLGGLLFDDPKEAYSFISALAGPEGELWQRRERRRAIIAAEEAAEEEALNEEKQALKEAARIAKKSIRTLSGRERKKIIREHRGAGSKAPSDSSAKHTDSIRMRVEEPLT